MKTDAPALSEKTLCPLFTDSELLARTLLLGKQSYFLFDAQTKALT